MHEHPREVGSRDTQQLKVEEILFDENFNSKIEGVQKIDTLKLKSRRGIMYCFLFTIKLLRLNDLDLHA